MRASLLAPDDVDFLLRLVSGLVDLDPRELLLKGLGRLVELKPVLRRQGAKHALQAHRLVCFIPWRSMPPARAGQGASAASAFALRTPMRSYTPGLGSALASTPNVA